MPSLSNRVGILRTRLAPDAKPGNRSVPRLPPENQQDTSLVPWLFCDPSATMEGSLLYMDKKTIQKAGAIILGNTDKNIIALLYRAKLKDWSFPKGHIEQGENAIQAMKREVLEETGLVVNILCELPDLLYTHPNGTAISTKMFLVQSENDSRTHQEHEGDAIQWVPIQKVNSTLSYDNLREYFKEVLPLIK